MICRFKGRAITVKNRTVFRAIFLLGWWYVFKGWVVGFVLINSVLGLIL